MTELSPAAQGIVDAYENTTDKYAALAAVIRTAIDGVVPPALEEEYHDRYQALPWDQSLPLKKMVEIRQKLNAIADELQAQ